MPSTFVALQNIVLPALGDRDDSDTLTIAKFNINTAAVVAAAIFKPPELEKQTTVTLSAGSSYYDVSGLTDFLSLLALYNNTDSIRMWPFSFEVWQVLVRTLSVGSTRYYTNRGNLIYVKDVPSVDKVFDISYLTHPPYMTNSSDSVGFDNYDSFITSLAIQLSWASLEEAESSNLFASITAFLVPFLGKQALDTNTIEMVLAKLRPTYPKSA
jgi:hypothetical protein